MQKLIVVFTLLLAVGCTAEKRAQVEVDLRKKLSPGCYTVDLFDPYEIKYPEAEVPQEYAAFLGVWQNGAWGGTWCHDLYITQVSADGQVVLLDAHGPDGAGIEATVFKRKGFIKDGVLTFLSIGSVPVSYRLVGDYLVGERKSAIGKVEITMSRTDGIALVPEPPLKPVRAS